MQREYEILYIVKPNLSDSRYDEIISKIKDLTEKNEGEILNIKPWGIRSIAPTFEKYQQGYYVESQFKATNLTLEAIKKYLQVTEDVVRHLIVNLDSVKPKLKEAKVG